MTETKPIALANQALLAKIDKLRETNVGAAIPLPQLVVVGDQSSGKSSVPESVTGFCFPRAAGLCTRYATQITCTRQAVSKVTISIIPRPEADGLFKPRLPSFERQLNRLNDEDLAKVFDEASFAMGIRIGTNDDNPDASAFGEDILKIEISGPEQTHLTVIDVPGIFRVATPGLTVESDVALVRNIVKRYMANPRTIILAVLPCNVDIATQEILKLAEEADPDGIRTMGVLTKPDLAIEKATQDAVVDLVQGRRNKLKLGYFVVKNRNADDTISTASDRLATENAFFMAPHWSSIATSCGTAALTARLRDLLLEISKRELPKVKAEIEKRKRQTEAQLNAMGEPRDNENTQRQYLVKIASRIQDITKSALNGHYADDTIFKHKADLRLITKMIQLNEDFSNVFWKCGHYQHFRSGLEDKGEKLLGEVIPTTVSGMPGNVYDELHDIIDTDYECPKPLRGPMTETVQELYSSSRGPELGTFNGTVLASVFDKSAQKWKPLVMSHTSKAILLVHDFIFNLLDELCPDSMVKEQLWGNVVDDLREKYKHAMKHACFLLEIEGSSWPITYNHYFNATLQTKRQKRLAESLTDLAVSIPEHEGTGFIPLDHIRQHTTDMDNKQQVCEDILDSLESYYKVARKRFVDTVCQHVVHYMLLSGPDSPLKVLSPDYVLKLTPDQLEIIAGEDTAGKSQRQRLTRELESLSSAIQILRT
ncbi:interferon-induced GTP-binding protein Mx2 [Stachybotrys elegans]|uniref:Interferon-induced GTP-binding protein Mx2 n=1 Tax=Stachybotrys elegans TaxID=80388 RepID=A0A8K0WRA1_9HYPO|nr:interferon-induced GTP-binding protein Mx2 [Stachybotrys elegans]